MLSLDYQPNLNMEAGIYEASKLPSFRGRQLSDVKEEEIYTIRSKKR